MAINPNTDFSSGAVLTAAQQNRFPRGIMALATSTTSDTSVTSEEVELGAISFTAVASRYYKISYIEPDIGITGAGAAAIVMRLRNGTTTAGTLLQVAYQWVPSSSVDTAGQVVWFGTFSAGTQNVVATAQNASGVTFQLNRGTGKAAWLVVEDIGPA
jgi:hypothetical protein